MPTLGDLLARQTAVRNQATARLTAQVRATWAGLGGHDEANVADLVRRVRPLVEAGQLTIGASTDAYLAGVLTEMTGRPVRPRGVPRADLVDVRPVPPDEVYRRPFVQTWTALSRGAAYDMAVRAGGDRLIRLVEDDLSLAHRRAVISVLGQEDRVTGYRRVIRPEKARTGTCGLCVAASDQRYSTEDLMPIHTRCGCDVMPILGRSGGRVVDPGRTFNQQDIEDAYTTATRSAGSTDGAALKAVRFTIHEHGELGPVLTPRGGGFTGPADIAA